MAKAIQKHAGGRPSKYTSAMFNKVREYLATCGREQTQLPSVSGLSVFLGVTRDTLYRWAKEYPELSDSLKELAERQQTQLIDDGMYGGKEVNASMAIFLLKALHGMRDGNITGIKVIKGDMTVEYLDYESTG